MDFPILRRLGDVEGRALEFSGCSLEGDILRVDLDGEWGVDVIAGDEGGNSREGDRFLLLSGILLVAGDGDDVL